MHSIHILARDSMFDLYGSQNTNHHVYIVSIIRNFSCNSYNNYNSVTFWVGVVQLHNFIVCLYINVVSL